MESYLTLAERLNFIETNNRGLELRLQHIVEYVDAINKETCPERISEHLANLRWTAVKANNYIVLIDIQLEKIKDPDCTYQK
jgi:hypothetical protein